MGGFLSGLAGAFQDIPIIGPMIAGIAGQQGQQQQNAANAAQVQQQEDFQWKSLMEDEKYNTAAQTRDLDFQSNQAAREMDFQASQVQGQEAFQRASQAEAERYDTLMSGTAYQRATADMRAAGVNPMLAIMQGGASAPTVQAMSGAAGSGAMGSGAMPSIGTLSGAHAQMGDVIGAGLASSAKAIQLEQQNMRNAIDYSQATSTIHQQAAQSNYINAQADGARLSNARIAAQLPYASLQARQDYINSQLQPGLVGAQIGETNARAAYDYSASNAQQAGANLDQQMLEYRHRFGGQSEIGKEVGDAAVAAKYLASGISALQGRSSTGPGGIPGLNPPVSNPRTNPGVAPRPSGPLPW